MLPFTEATSNLRCEHHHYERDGNKWQAELAVFRAVLIDLFTNYSLLALTLCVGYTQRAAESSILMEEEFILA